MRPLVALASLALVSCLPVDTRPEPGRLVVTVVPDDVVQNGFVTTDGWSMEYDQILVSIGNVQLEGAVQNPDPDVPGSCTQYTEESTSYLRILDLRRPESQKVATTYALGDCVLGLEVVPPFDNVAALGAGVHEAESDFMFAPAPDPLGGAESGVAIHLVGSATKADATVRFAWTFRRPFGYRRCATATLHGGDSGTVEMRFRPQVLFETARAPDEELQFEPYAAADANTDGEVTLEELKAESLSDSAPFQSLADRLYLDLAPRMLEAADGTQCFDQVRQSGPQQPRP